MQCMKVSTVVVAIVVVLSSSRAQMPGISMPAGMPGMPGPPPHTPVGPAPPGVAYGPPPVPVGGGGYPQIQSSHCRYLINAPSPWGTNASPFKLYTRSYSGEIRRGYPVEVSILPFYEAFKFFNFTDFALWAEPQFMAMPNRVEPEMARLAGVSRPPGGITHLGVWQVFPQYAGGSGSMKCNMFSRGEDTVGSFEARMLELLKTQFPTDSRLLGFEPSARRGCAFLWYPDERTMGNAGAIKFVAKLKSFGQWFKLESTPWRVYRPPPPRPRMTQQHEMQEFSTYLENYQNMRNRLKYMERSLERAGAPGV